MVPGYKKIKDISHGPLTSVILCRQESLDREVILKILHPQHAEDSELVERFIREAKMYARLKHANIVNVIDLGKQNGSYYIAMEYVDGYSLDEFIKKYANLPLNIAIYIISKVLTGLQYAHESGIIHRDIKPSNIMISKKGDVKITDFGLARPLNLSAITEQGNILGTPSYLAPELARSESATIASDIFALGASFYELLTKENLFAGESVAETINKILNLKPIPILKKRNEVPEWLSVLILNMIEKKSSRRPQSCGTILSEIKKNINIISKDDFFSFLKNKTSSTSVIVEENIKNTKSTKLIYSTAAGLIITVFVIYGLYSSEKNIEQNKLGQEKIVNIQDSLITDSLKFLKNKNLANTEPDNIKETLKTKSKKIKIEPDRISGNTNSESEQIIENQKIPGKLFINVMPWADVFINGKKIDTTPLDNAIELIPGIYNIELRNPAYTNYAKSVEIFAGKNDSINVLMQQAFGSLKLIVVPWGKIFINKEYVDMTPIAEPIKLKTGQNELEVVNPNFAKHTELVEIKAGETLEKTIYLKN